MLILASVVASDLAIADGAREMLNRREQLQKQDLRSVSAALRKANPSLSRFWVADKRPVHKDYSAMVITAVDATPAAAYVPWAGVFIVYGRTNQVYMVLDASAAPACCTPQLGRTTSDLVYVDWFSDYGFYGGTRKYSYDLSKRQAPQRYAFHRFSVKTAETRGSEQLFIGAYEAPTDVGAEPPPENTALVHRIAEQKWYAQEITAGQSSKSRQDAAIPAIPDRVLKAVPEFADGIQTENEAVFQVNADLWLCVLSGWVRQKSGVYLVNSHGRAQFYSVPVPTLETYTRLRTNLGKIAFAPATPGFLDNSIGPYAFDGEKLWFANQFYDGEGQSGVGALGTFDPVTARYEMRYLPEIAPWSASVLRVEDEFVWIGLMRQPEGNVSGAGVLRFQKGMGTVREYPITDYVATLTRSGSALYFGTVHGVHVLDTNEGTLTHIRIEPGRNGLRQVTAIATSVP
jgi:hypothetical protein